MMRLFKIFAIFLISVSTVGCLGTKSLTDVSNIKKEKEKSEVNNDSISETNTNQEIKDRIVVNVPETDNAEVMAMFEMMMRQLNTSKSSGSNSYKAFYDEQMKQFVIDIMVAATQNKETNVVKDSKIEKSVEERVSSYIKKRITNLPWWVWGGLIFWFLPNIISKIQLIINPLSGLINQFKNKHG